MKTLLTFLLLCSAALADGPLFGIWHIDGHGYQWQQNQIDAGYPVEPSIRMISAELREGGAIVNGVPKQIGILNGNAALLSKMSGGPIVLRMNNITSEIDDTLPRFAVTEANKDQSILCVKRVNGVLDQTPNPDPFGPLCKWTEVGQMWADAAWMRRLQEIVQPSAIILRENNEGPRIKFKQLFKQVLVKKKDANGVVYFETTNTWNSRATLEGLSIRIADWVDERQSRDPASCESEFVAAETERYRALYAGFCEKLSPAWKAVPFRTVAYGGFPDNRQNDTASIALYLGWYSSSILTSPEHEQRLAAYQADWQTAGWRELSVTMLAPVTTDGAQSGDHAIVDPESCAGFFTAVAWGMQAPGVEVREVWWDNANTPPGFVLTSPKPAVQEYLNSIGRSDVANATVEDFELALMRQFERIRNHPIIGRYWREGTTRVLSSPLNTATANRVYARETTIPGESRKLLYVYSPCDLTGEIEVGEWSVPAKRFAYWLTPVSYPLQEIQ